VRDNIVESASEGRRITQYQYWILSIPTFQRIMNKNPTSHHISALIDISPISLSPIRIISRDNK
jgi:hypothetical protein